jgi:hypothetical protein
MQENLFGGWVGDARQEEDKVSWRMRVWLGRFFAPATWCDEWGVGDDLPATRRGIDGDFRRGAREGGVSHHRRVAQLGERVTRQEEGRRHRGIHRDAERERETQTHTEKGAAAGGCLSRQCEGKRAN